MSNHYHLVLYVNQQQADAWDDQEVIDRWTELFPRNAAIVETLQKNMTSAAARKQLRQTVKQWRERLADISWFMRCINESIARQANREDECTGRFWEGRFKSQALLDEKALVTCMAYVDLNPIRAGVSDSLEASDFTSIQERLIGHARKVKTRSYRQQRLLSRRRARHLLDRQATAKQAGLRSMAELDGLSQAPLPITQRAYFELLQSTCTALHSTDPPTNMMGGSSDKKHRMLTLLGISADAWLKSVTAFHRHYSVAAGTEAALIHFQESRIKAGVHFKHPHKWVRGIHSSRLLYGT